jgi:hypothetical protein
MNADSGADFRCPIFLAAKISVEIGVNGLPFRLAAEIENGYLCGQ